MSGNSRSTARSRANTERSSAPEFQEAMLQQGIQVFVATVGEQMTPAMDRMSEAFRRYLKAMNQ